MRVRFQREARRKGEERGREGVIAVVPYMEQARKGGCVCMCTCTCMSIQNSNLHPHIHVHCKLYTHTHTHTHKHTKTDRHTHNTHTHRTYSKDLSTDVCYPVLLQRSSPSRLDQVRHTTSSTVLHHQLRGRAEPVQMTTPMSLHRYSTIA